MLFELIWMVLKIRPDGLKLEPRVISLFRLDALQAEIPTGFVSL